MQYTLTYLVAQIKKLTLLMYHCNRFVGKGVQRNHWGVQNSSVYQRDKHQSFKDFNHITFNRLKVSPSIHAKVDESEIIFFPYLSLA